MKALLFASLLAIAACGNDGDVPDEQEVITTVILEFESGGTTLTFEFDDPDGDGGDPPLIDDIELPAGDYTLRVSFENRLESPAEDITQEIADEGDDHLVLLSGTAVVGPATSNGAGPLRHEYADTDANGLPIGLENDITATAGTGTLTVTLRHMPPELPPVKAEETPALFADDQPIGGSTDVQVTFDVTVL